MACSTEREAAQIFLGFAGYNRRFLKNYACIVKPLNDLLIGHPTNPGIDQKKKKKKKSKVPWQWGEPQQAAFDMIKDKLASPPVLVYVQPVEKLTYDKNSSSRFKIIKRHETELKWIKLLQTPFPLGFNDNIYHEGNISKI